MPSYPLSVAVVCMSNMNRSMEAHRILRRKGFRVRSFGAGSRVRLPGTAHNLQMVYDFSTTYEEMRKDLARKDRERYKSNGILHILGRNERIKPRPERFQECRDRFDVIFTCEESVYDRVVEELWVREQETCQPVHVINVDMDDDTEDATLGAFLICELCERLQQADDLDDSLVEVLMAAERKTGKSFLHTVCFYRGSSLVSAPLGTLHPEKEVEKEIIFCQSNKNALEASKPFHGGGRWYGFLTWKENFRAHRAPRGS